MRKTGESNTGNKLKIDGNETPRDLNILSLRTQPSTKEVSVMRFLHRSFHINGNVSGCASRTAADDPA